MTWDPSLAGKKCDGCGHALSRHNTLAYCRHWSKRDGHCICGDWRAEQRWRFNSDGSVRTSSEGVPNGVTVLAVLAGEQVENDLVEHANRDGLTGVARAVFLDRGRHAPGERCPRASVTYPEHEIWCDWPDRECECRGMTP